MRLCASREIVANPLCASTVVAVGRNQGTVSALPVEPPGRSPSCGKDREPWSRGAQPGWRQGVLGGGQGRLPREIVSMLRPEVQDEQTRREEEMGV